jgi:hypothetical protein
VKRYTVFRPTDDAHYVVIDLEFEDLDSAKRALEALRQRWKKVDGKIMVDPKVRTLDIVESKTY